MDYQSEKSNLTQKDFDKLKKESLNEKLTILSIKDIPLEKRREEAKKPLFLIRYE
ncbi:MAG TPA: hypothetical protein VLU95_03420 [Candidatus Acidoferrum sp.]|nr:hypothetical protein [Candidatus Acidoferrum sp.]